MILDASVAAKWFLPGEDLMDEARAVRQAMLDRSVALAAPIVLWSELANAVVRAVRRGRIEYERAISIASELFEVQPLIEPIDLDGHAAIRTALTTGLNAYDAQYLASAAGRGSSVLTADRRMFERCREYGYEVVWLGDVTLRDGVLVDTPQGYQ
jgi:predicted nucleic acid-binding protein